MSKSERGMRAVTVAAGGWGRASWVLMLGACLCLALALAPWNALGQTSAPAFAYSGAAEGDVAELLLAPTAGQPAALEVTLGEATGAVNSTANIIPDSPGSPENEAEDFSVGTATPLRLAAGDTVLAQPFSVQSSAPADAGGSNALLDINEDPVTLRLLRAETQSQAALDATTAATQNDTEIANVQIQGLALVPFGGRVNADVARAADGSIRGFADSAVDGPTTILPNPADPANPLISAQAITASSESTANGTTSNNTTDFKVLGLAIAGTEGVTIDAGPSPNPECVTVTFNLAGGTVITADLPRGVNLLDPETFDDNPSCGADVPLGDLLTALRPILSPLTGEQGVLEGTKLILGGGFSEDGDGTFARGLIEAIRLDVAAGADTRLASAVLGRAFSAVDAARANSPNVDFTPVRQATPAETIFTNPVPQPPAPEPEPEPEAEEEEEEPEPEAEAEPAAAAEEEPEELPFTGLALAPIAAGGVWLLVGGSLLRIFSTRRRD